MMPRALCTGQYRVRKTSRALQSYEVPTRRELKG
jgi:hypothetical protein